MPWNYRDGVMCLTIIRTGLNAWHLLEEVMCLIFIGDGLRGLTITGTGSCARHLLGQVNKRLVRYIHRISVFKFHTDDMHK